MSANDDTEDDTIELEVLRTVACIASGEESLENTVRRGLKACSLASTRVDPRYA